MSPVLSSSQTAALLIFGAGGHARVVADAALSANMWLSIAASDRNPALCEGTLLAGVPLFKPDEVSTLKHTLAVHVAIGNNRHRESESALWGHERLASVIHPASQVSRFACVGLGCFVAACAVVAPGARLGMGSIVNHGAVVDHDVDVGVFSHVAPNAVLGGAVKVGRRVLVGAGAVLLPGVIVGDDIVVGASAVVRSKLTEPGVYAGVPARRIR